MTDTRGGQLGPGLGGVHHPQLPLVRSERDPVTGRRVKVAGFSRNPEPNPMVKRTRLVVMLLTWKPSKPVAFVYAIVSAR